MIRSLVLGLVLFVYSTFLLGKFSLPPGPGRLYAVENIGASRIGGFDTASRALVEKAHTVSFPMIFGIGMAIFIAWLIFRFSRDLRYAERKFPTLSFISIFLVSFVLADYARETAVRDPAHYFKTRTDWIRKGSPMGYPLSPTRQLVAALTQKRAGELDLAFDAVVEPEFGNLGNLAPLPLTCRETLRSMVSTTPPPKPEPGQKAHFPFACELVKKMVTQFLQPGALARAECVYGPSVKILHALDRQGLVCDWKQLPPDFLPPEELCSRFSDFFATKDFSFCQGH